MKDNFIMMKVLCTLTCLFMMSVPEYSGTSQKNFYRAVEEINEQHAVEIAHVQDVDIKAYTPEMKEFEVGFTAAELDSMTDYGKYKGAATRLTYEEAAEDVNLVFKVLKNCYGAYFYFGGDIAFEKAKKQILLDCAVDGENLTVGILRESLKRNLGFVKDGHFLIDNESILEKAVYYSNEETVFIKDEKGYYTEQDEKRNYVSLVDGSDAVEKYMKRSINDKGMLIYRLGILSTNEIETVEVAFENRIEKFVLLPPKTEINNTENSTYYSDYEANGVYVVAIRSFMYEQAGSEFVRSAETARNSKVSILDLRGNSGGMSKYVTDWLEIYDPVLSEYASGNTYVYRQSQAANYLIYKNLGKYLSKQESARLLSNYRSGRNSWETKETSVFSRRRNRNLLFVLVDSRTFSASEWMIAALRNKDNVIFVGTNSGGGLMSDNSIKIVLPNSKINIQCGSGLGFYYDETVFTEEIGFFPDIWMSANAMKYTLNLISYYGL